MKKRHKGEQNRVGGVRITKRKTKGKSLNCVRRKGEARGNTDCSIFQVGRKAAQEGIEAPQALLKEGSENWEN